MTMTEIPQEEIKAKQMPVPSGFHVLCMVPEIKDEFESGIVKADITKTFEERLTTVLFVIALGPDCYKDVARFPTGSRLKIHGREFRLINDDNVEGVVQDPRGIARA